MQRINVNGDRQHRLLLLSRRLEEISAARNELVIQRDELVAQLGDLERQAKAAQLEFNALRNLDAPISTLPDEMLAMIFGAGILFEKNQGDLGLLCLILHVIGVTLR